MIASGGANTSVVAAFDRLAEEYDATFTFSSIGKMQRRVVWERLLTVFPVGGTILELNCGTGIDASFMINAGMNVTACDASPHMIEIARRRTANLNPRARGEFIALATEDLHTLHGTSFDGLLSNFAGLNCVSDLKSFSREAASRLKPGAPVLLCFLTRFCMWESVYYLLRGSSRKALRRCSGTSLARIDEFSFCVYYRWLSELRRIFAPEFWFVKAEGIGITVPPSYLEPWMACFPRLVRQMGAIDDLVRTWPGLRVIGDHMLVHLEKVRSC